VKDDDNMKLKIRDGDLFDVFFFVLKSIIKMINILIILTSILNFIILKLA